MLVKKEMIIVFLLILLSASILAQDPGILPSSPLYGIEKTIDNINLATKTGEDKALTALQIKKERLAEAQFLMQQGIKVNIEDVEEAILDAQEKAEIVEKEVTPKIEKEVKEESKETITTLKGIKEEIKNISLEEIEAPKDFAKLEKLINKNIAQEEKIRLASELVKNIGDYCEKLAMQDYSLMESDEKCNPDQEDAPDWLKELIKEDIAKREEQAKQEMISQLTTCVIDPRQCDCSKIPVKKHQQECEENTALAIKCEYENDMSACDELQSKPIVPEDMPAFLRPFFESTMKELIAQKEEQMFKKFAPPECIEANARTRESCEAIMREKYGEPPEECKDVRSKEECESILIASGKIPQECIENGKVISQEECMNKMLPEPCKQAGAFTREACESIMSEFRGSQQGPPPECLKDGEFIGQEECEAIMREKFASGGPGITQPSEGSEQRCNTNEDCIRTICPAAIVMDTPTCENNKCCCGDGEACKGAVTEQPVTEVSIPKYGQNEVIVTNENGTELIKIEEIKQIINEIEQIPEEEIGHTEETLALQQDIQRLEQETQEIEQMPEEEIKEFAEQIEEKVQEEIEKIQPEEIETTEQPAQEVEEKQETSEPAQETQQQTPVGAVTGAFLKVFDFFQQNLNQ